MKNLVAVFLLVICILPGGACTLKNTPRHSLDELRTALLNHDADTALRYIDVDSIVDCMVKDMFLRYEAKAGSPLDALGLALGKEAAQLAMPAAKEFARRQVKNAITSSDESGYFSYIRKGSVWYLNIDAEGDTAWVAPKGKSDIKFRMTRAPEGHWRIVQIVKE